MKRTALTFLILTGFVGVYVSCTEPPPPSLNYQERLLVDSLYNKGVDSIRPLLDSLCTRQFDSLVQVGVDSMMKERLEEIEHYLDRIKNERSEQE